MDVVILPLAVANGIGVIFSSLPKGTAILMLAIAALLAYFLGCLNGAVLVSKYILQDDVREHGSGNAGLTNFYRCFGGKLTLLVLVADMLKMLVAVFFSYVIFSIAMPHVPIFARYWAGFFCALGHMFPVTFGFRGGKGILSGGALALTLDWRIALTVWGIFILIAVFTKLVSFGSCVASLALPIASVLVYRAPSVFLVSLATALLIIWQHRGNLLRLFRGKESKFSFRNSGQARRPRMKEAEEDQGESFAVPHERRRSESR